MLDVEGALATYQKDGRLVPKLMRLPIANKNQHAYRIRSIQQPMS
tara:strand:- start:490 stop:624 length:135 start_codon:yes stop_codon:yes gene_type:complete